MKDLVSAYKEYDKKQKQIIHDLEYNCNILKKSVEEKNGIISKYEKKIQDLQYIIDDLQAEFKEENSLGERYLALKQEYKALNNTHAQMLRNYSILKEESNIDLSIYPDEDLLLTNAHLKRTNKTLRETNKRLQKANSDLVYRICKIEREVI